ncbi:helix-turn-helix transcriptional regulator [Nodosilinea sp. AN01ver1]|uniref:helix-turn-helix transcriptional regulator n=1 Tax=Nodosilinea sp. AN01ver1 TaxID=3423362 RepID=UPI003D315CF6
MVHDLEFWEQAIVERSGSDEAARLGVSFCLSGNIRRLSSNADDEVQLQAGRVSLGVTNGPSRVVEYAARQRVVLVHLHVQPAAIGLFDLETAQQLPAELRQAIAGGDRASYFNSQATTPVMAATLQQLLHCPYQGLVQRLYMESKALELIGLCFDQILTATSPAQGSGLKADEIDRIFYARDILLGQVANPPTLLELSHQVGLNDRKLKQGFRQVFGTTVFGYLHSYRMEQAEQLLLLPEATIASVAQRVGYRSPEAFSVAFRRTFEVSPKAYQLANGCKGKKSA